MSRRAISGACLALLWSATAARAQDPAPAAPAVNWDLYETNPAEPDFTLVNLPTALRLPRHRLAFRISHRFARPLGEGDFGDLLGDFFGLDGGAQIGMGLRFADAEPAVRRELDALYERALEAARSGLRR